MTRMPSRESIALAISTSRESFALSGRIHSSRSLTRGAISFWRTARRCSGGRPLIDCPHAKPASILVMAASAIGETTIGCLLGAFDAMSAAKSESEWVGVNQFTPTVSGLVHSQAFIKLQGEENMILARSQVGRSIAVILRRATNLSAVRAARSRPITAEEAEAWSLRREERRA